MFCENVFCVVVLGMENENVFGFDLEMVLEENALGFISGEDIFSSRYRDHIAFILRYFVVILR